MKQTTLPIKGMHCASCELLIEDELKELPGVKKVNVSLKKRCAYIGYEGTVSVDDLSDAVKRAGYEIGIQEKVPWISRNIEDYFGIIFSGVALFFLYNIVYVLGLTRVFDSAVSKPSSLVAVLLLGLTAGVSTCMALVGGLVLGITAQYNKIHANESRLKRFVPHIFFNGGRIISYVLLGGLIGLLGGVFQLSSLSLGFMTLAVALVMLTLGIQLTQVSPKLSEWKLTLPSGLSKMLGIQNQAQKEYSPRQAFMMGALTFFLPCGFTQAMQLYAISTGSFLSGALIMGTFALGTAPGLLGIGGLTSVLKGTMAQKFFRFAGVFVIVLSLYNAQNGFNLMGINPGAILKANATSPSTLGTTEAGNGDVQLLKATYTENNDLIPSEFAVVAGKPVRLEIAAKTDGVGCMGSIMIPRVTKPEYFEKGKTVVFTFTPKSAGNFPLTCAMGVPWGNIKAS